MNAVDNLNSVQVINKPCMSSRRMSLLPRTALHSDSEQEYLHLCRSIWKKSAQDSRNICIYVEVHGRNGLKSPGISAFMQKYMEEMGSRIYEQHLCRSPWKKWAQDSRNICILCRSIQKKWIKNLGLSAFYVRSIWHKWAQESRNICILCRSIRKKWSQESRNIYIFVKVYGRRG